MTNLWRQQQAAFDFAVDRAASMLAICMGGGKSRVAIELLNHWRCNRMLILCPLSVLNVWRREFAKWWPEAFRESDYTLDVLNNGSVKAKRQQADEAYSYGSAIIVVNYESARLDPLGSWILSRPWDAVVLDESHRCKGPTSKISHFVAPKLYARKSGLADRAKRRLCLTGTPMPHSPLDVFGQCRFLDWRVFGKNWGAFRQSYACCDNPMIPKQITGFQNLDILQERFGRLAFQVGPEVLDLPPVSHHMREFELVGMAARIYRDLERDFMAKMEAGVVTASNALVKTLRLRQVVSGFVQPDETDAIVDLHQGKEALLEDLLQDIVMHPDPSHGRCCFGPDLAHLDEGQWIRKGEPAVIFAEFTHDLRAVERVAQRLGFRYGEVSGRRKDLTGEATLPDDVDVLAVQYKAGGLGIDLSRARYGIYYSPTYSLGDYEQSMARLHRPGQKYPVQFYHLVAKGTIDEAVYRALEKKRNIIEGVLAFLRAKQLIEAPGETDAEKVMNELEKIGGAITALDELKRQ